MRRKYGSLRLRGGVADEGDINPMDGLGNLADVMLVFACGLMLALITFWNVDVAAVQSAAPDAPPQEIVEELSDADGASETAPDGENLEQVGTVYRDPATGKLYMKSEE